MKIFRIVIVAVLAMGVLGCQTAYYGTMEKFGYAKRDILIDRVEDATETQAEVKEEFQAAYQAFNQLLSLQTTPLEHRYETLNDAYLDSRDKADELTDRIDSIESVAEALFEEWQEELDQYTDKGLRAASARQLSQAKTRYKSYLRELHRSEAKMKPVLAVFKDQVLFLKHNLNAEKISSLKGEVKRFDSDVKGLVSAMDRSIAEAKTFIKGLE